VTGSLKACATCKREYRTETDFLSDTRRWRVCTSGHLWFNCSCGSTLMIPKGKYEWYSPEKFLRGETKSVFNKLGNLKDLPHIPTVVMELQLLLQDPDTSPKAIATALRKDPVLATQLIQLAENLRKSRNPANPPIKSLEHATVYVGHKTMSDLVMTCALRSMPLPPSEFDAQAFWEESYLTGALAEALVTRFQLKLNLDEVYLAASLCNIGKLILAFCFPPLVTKISRDVKDPKTHATWRQAEAAYQFPAHSILGEIAASLWGMPELVMLASRRHHDLADESGKLPFHLYDVIALANQLCHWVNSDPHRIEEPVLRSYTRKLGLSDPDVENLAAELLVVRRAILGH
jgi:HD-like signal output (HDOD) protein